MAEALALRAVPVPRETDHSFLGRMAALNVLDTHSFVGDFGLQFRSFLTVKDEAVTALGALAGLSSERMAEMVSWTGQPSTDGRMTYCGEEHIVRALREPAVRGCPLCLREDMDGHEDRPERWMALRGDWLSRDVRVCLRHRRPLVDLWTEKAVTERYDVQRQIRKIAPAILAGDLDWPEISVTPYDTWLDGRLADGSDGTWLAEVPVRAATATCRLLGGELLRRQIVETEGADPLVVGFEVLSKGPEAILASLDDLFHASPGATDKLKVVYGRFYSQLRHEHLSDPGFAPVLGLLRDHIAARWPLAAGEDLVGSPMPARRLHSITSASEATGVSKPLLERILISTGAIAADDPLPRARRTFDAVEHAELLGCLPRLVGTRNMKRLCGLTQDQFAALVEVGMLAPYLDPDVTEHPWDPEDGHALFARLLDGAPSIDPSDGGWESLSRAINRRHLSHAILFRALRDGRLCAGRHADRQGINAIHVRQEDVDRTFPPSPRSETTVAEFARSVGLRDGTTLPGMIEDGFVQSIEIANPRTGRTDSCMTLNHIATFRARFVTLSELAEERREHYNTVLAWLRSAGVSPVSSSTRTYERVYFRRDVET